MGICYKRWSSCGSDPTSRFEAHALLATDSYQTSPKFSTKNTPGPLLKLYKLPAYQVGSKISTHNSMKKTPGPNPNPTTQNTHPRQGHIIGISKARTMGICRFEATVSCTEAIASVSCVIGWSENPGNGNIGSMRLWGWFFFVRPPPKKKKKNYFPR